ncbi:MAG: hypothetical protein WCK48_01925 [bacterium]
MKFIHIFLFVLIIIGVSLLATQKLWIPQVVSFILKYEAQNVVINNPLNTTYIIEGQKVKLVKGTAFVTSVPGSASKDVIMSFGGILTSDINKDEIPDSVLLLTKTTGGSGTFYYVVASISNKKSFVGTNAVYIGDRIAPQNLSIKDGEIVLNYADRNPGEPFSTKPSLGVSKYYRVENGELKEVKK